jgi:hypothetical protein
MRYLVATASHRARRNLVSLWAYTEDALDDLERWFAELPASDEAYGRAAVALSRKAAAECPRLARDEARRLHAAGVYARHVLQGTRYAAVAPSLSWLRAAERANRHARSHRLPWLLEVATPRGVPMQPDLLTASVA